MCEREKESGDGDWCMSLCVAAKIARCVKREKESGDGDWCMSLCVAAKIARCV